MHDRFTDGARQIMQLANDEALRLNHEYIGTEHILLGLAKVESGIAACVLKNMNVQLHKIAQESERYIQAGPSIVTLTRMPQTPRARESSSMRSKRPTDSITTMSVASTFCSA